MTRLQPTQRVYFAADDALGFTSMNDGSSHEASSKKEGGVVIKPWLSGGLIVALVGNLVLSGVLILQLGTFEDTRRQAQEVQAGIAKTRTELATLQVEVESLTKQKEALAPTIVDWEKRVKEKAEAEALLATLDAKKRQIESDIALGSQRLGEVNQNLVSAEKQHSELNSEIEKLRTELASLTKTKTDAKTALAMAAEAERRSNEAQNALASAEARRKQVETDANQRQKEADDARQERDKLKQEAAALPQQIQALKDQLSTSQSDLKATQDAVQQEEQKLTQLRSQVTSAEARLNELIEQEQRQRRAESELSDLTNHLEQIRKDVGDWEFRRDTAKADFQKTDSDLAAARKLLQEVSAKHDELIRESSDLEAAIDRLTKEKETKEKELGQLDAQRPTPQKAD